MSCSALSMTTVQVFLRFLAANIYIYIEIYISSGTWPTSASCPWALSGWSIGGGHGAVSSAGGSKQSWLAWLMQADGGTSNEERTAAQVCLVTV